MQCSASKSPARLARNDMATVAHFVARIDCGMTYLADGQWSHIDRAVDSTFGGWLLGEQHDALMIDEAHG
jgi:hypothetical protein